MDNKIYTDEVGGRCAATAEEILQQIDNFIDDPSYNIEQVLQIENIHDLLTEIALVYLNTKIVSNLSENLLDDIIRKREETRASASLECLIQTPIVNQKKKIIYGSYILDPIDENSEKDEDSEEDINFFITDSPVLSAEDPYNFIQPSFLEDENPVEDYEVEEFLNSLYLPKPDDMPVFDEPYQEQFIPEKPVDTVFVTPMRRANAPIISNQQQIRQQQQFLESTSEQQPLFQQQQKQKQKQKQVPQQQPFQQQPFQQKKVPDQQTFQQKPLPDQQAFQQQTFQQKKGPDQQPFQQQPFQQQPFQQKKVPQQQIFQEPVVPQQQLFQEPVVPQQPIVLSPKVLQPNIKIAKSVVCQTDILVPPVSRKVKVFNEGSQTTVVNSNVIGTQTDPPICGPNLTPEKTIQENKTGFFNIFNKKPAKTIAFERFTQTDPNFELPQEVLNLYRKSKGLGPTMITTETQTVPIIIQKPQVQSPLPPPGFLEKIGLVNKKDKKVKLVTTGQQTDPVFVRTAREYENIFTVNSQYFDERIKTFLAKTKFNEPVFYPEIIDEVPPSPVYLTRKPECQEELVYATKYKPEKIIQPSPFRHTGIIYSQEYLQYLKMQGQQQAQQKMQQMQQKQMQQMQQKQIQQMQQGQQTQQMQQRQQMQQMQQRQQMQQMQQTQQRQQMQQMQQKQVKFKSSRGYM